MAADWLFGLLRHPIAVAIWLGVLVAASLMTYGGRSSRPPPISPVRLVAAYAVVFVLCAVISVCDAYVSQEEAAAVWHVPREHYQQVLFREIGNVFASVAAVSGLGIALVGVPTIFWLARRGRAQIGWVLLASACISVTFSITLGVLLLRGSVNWLQSFVQLLVYSLLVHLLLSLGFSIGAGLPWRSQRAGG